MRVGFLGPFSGRYNADYGSERQIGAIEQQVFGVGQELARLGHEVYISRNWEGPATKDHVGGVHFSNVNFFTSKGRSFYDSPFPFGRLSQAHYLFRAPARLRELQLDIFIAPGVIPAFVSLFAFRRSAVPKVFVANNNDMFVHRGTGHSRIPSATRAMMRGVGRRYDAAIALTRGGQNYLRSRGIACDIVIPDAVNPEMYRNKDEEGFILTAGRLVPHKKIEVLLRVFSRICSIIPERLLIIGSGPCDSEVRKLAATLGVRDRVHFEPFLPQPTYRDRLSKCSFFVLPSSAEAFGVALLEAMASGKAVIAREIIGPGDVITHDHDGFLFRNESELKQQMILLSGDKDLRTRLGKHAREKVERNFTFRTVGLEYQRFLGSLLS